jgi:hypothetical protein
MAPIAHHLPKRFRRHIHEILSSGQALPSSFDALTTPIYASERLWQQHSTLSFRAGTYGTQTEEHSIYRTRTTLAFRHAVCADRYAGLRGKESCDEGYTGNDGVFRAYLASLANGEAAEIRTLRYELDDEEMEATGIVVVELGKRFPRIRLRVFVMSDCEDVDGLLGRFERGVERVRDGVDELDDELSEKEYGSEHVERLVGLAKTLLVTAMES